MHHRPPTATRSDTLSPTPTLFRSPILTVNSPAPPPGGLIQQQRARHAKDSRPAREPRLAAAAGSGARPDRRALGRMVRSEEHTSELQSLMRTSYAGFCWKKNTNTKEHTSEITTQYEIPSTNN